ncbi:ATP-binding protein [Bacillus sp. HMF5848]|uniref:ATP-binding protein n=1 Tax=Bacillus sp. HMF5848 TaxID=2495421 RepID=UPI000F76F3F2|nr:ATP-binding protein [Bacillus sp. HMF5848]RSK26207.1 ATP-binding protein [Bacillus sp. HMF5848]
MILLKFTGFVQELDYGYYETIIDALLNKNQLQEIKQLVMLACHEAMVNVFEAGQRQTGEQQQISIEFEYRHDDYILLTTRNYCESHISLLQILDEKKNSQDLTRPRGRGLILMDAFMDEMSESRDETGRLVLQLKKYI